MRDILDELIRLFPLFSVRSLCDDHLALDDSLRDWLEDRCAMFRNDTTCFGPEDSLTVTATIPLDQRHVAESEGVFHAFQPGSKVSIDAWFVAGRSALDGGMTLGPSRPLPGGGRIIPVVDAIFELDFRGRGGAHRLSTASSDGVEPRPAGWIVLDASGVGRFGVRLRVDGVLPDVEGPIWFECPAAIVRSRLMIESPAECDALDLFPVVPSVRQLFDVIDDPHGKTSSSDEYGFDPCERVGGITRRALAWLQRLRFVFPDCFATTEARGDGRAITPKTDLVERGSPACSDTAFRAEAMMSSSSSPIRCPEPLRIHRFFHEELVSRWSRGIFGSVPPWWPIGTSHTDTMVGCHESASRHFNDRS